MQASELRIGNFVKETYNGSILNITSIRQIAIDGERIDGQKFDGMSIGDMGSIKPIPLTPEWLEKAGFKFDIVFDDARPSWIASKPNKENFILDEAFQPTDAGFPICDYQIKYIHQLQNLYFALTGEELQFKDK